MTKGSLLVTDNTDCDDIDDNDNLPVDCEVESYAAATANSTSQPRETPKLTSKCEKKMSQDDVRKMTQKTPMRVEQRSSRPGWVPPLKTFKIPVPGTGSGVPGPRATRTRGPEDQRTRGPGPGTDDETHHALALKRGGR